MNNQGKSYDNIAEAISPLIKILSPDAAMTLIKTYYADI